MCVLRAVVAGLLLVGLLVSCGDSDEASEAPATTTTTSEAATTTTIEAATATATDAATLTSASTTTTGAPTTLEDLEPLTYQYSAEAAPRFIGRQLGHVTFVDPDGDPETEGWYHPWGPWPADESEGWTLMLARRMPPPYPTSRWDADLIMVADTGGTIVDALLVSGNSIGREATIGLSCEGTLPAVLIGQNDTPIRAWKVSAESLTLTEVDPGDLTAAELESACLNRT